MVYDYTSRLTKKNTKCNLNAGKYTIVPWVCHGVLGTLIKLGRMKNVCRYLTSDSIMLTSVSTCFFVSLQPLNLCRPPSNPGEDYVDRDGHTCSVQHPRWG